MGRITLFNVVFNNLEQLVRFLLCSDNSVYKISKLIAIYADTTFSNNELMKIF